MADAEDLTSQTFVSAYKSNHRLRNPKKFFLNCSSDLGLIVQV
jgi:DNA-directed RNA polymerase specialized sigma24 family protein